MHSPVQAHLETWSLPIPVTLALVLAAFVYWRGWFGLRKAFPQAISVWQLVAFMSGLFSLWIAVGSPLAAFDHYLLSIHMVQALGRILNHPVFCWLAAMVVLIAWHVPAVFALGRRSHFWHGVEHACFFAAGLLFWWPVVQPWPSVARWPRWGIPLYLFLATLPCDALSAFLAFCDRVVYSHYLTAPRLFTISPLQDQQCAGALMWVCATFVYLIPAVVVTIQILSPPGTHLVEQPKPHRTASPGGPIGADVEVV